MLWDGGDIICNEPEVVWGVATSADVAWLCWSEDVLVMCKIMRRYSSAKSKSVQKPHAHLLDTPVALTSALKYFQMLPGPPGALQCALRLFKSILRCFWKYVQLWRCIQDATRLTIRIFKFWSCWDLYTGLQETLRASETSVQALQETWCHILTAVVLRVAQPQGISSIVFDFVTVTRFATSYHGMYCLSLSIYIHTEIQG